jgi:hypothetical protein
MYATVLTSLNAPSVERLMNQRASFLQVPPEMRPLQQHLASVNMRNVLDPHFASLGTAFGVWSDDVAPGCLLAVIFTLFSNQQPCYYINKAYTAPGAPLDTLSVGLKRVMEFHEELGYRRFYALYSQSHLETYKRLWRKHALLQHYDCYTEYESAPNERPKFHEFWELLYGRMLYNEPMIVRAFIQHEHERTRTTPTEAESGMEC